MGIFADLLRLTRLTSDPPVASEADMWYRSDLSQVHVHDGVNVLRVGPDATHPYVRTNGWHSLPAWGSATTMVPQLDQVYALPFIIGRSATLTEMAINITILGSGNVRGGIYLADHTTGLPADRVSDFGTLSTGLPGVKTWTGLSLTLKPIPYFAVIVQQGIAATYSARSTGDPWIAQDGSQPPVFGQERNAYVRSGVAGALPATFGAPTGTALGPSVFLKLS